MGLVVLLLMSLPAQRSPAATRPVARPERMLFLGSLSVDGQVVVQRRPFAFNATHPDLVRLTNGRILAAFDLMGGKTAEPRGILVSESTDDGRTWSPASPVVIVGETPKRDLSSALRARHATLVALADGRVRMFFTVTARNQATSKPSDSPAVMICSAISSNGRDFQLERGRVCERTDATDLRAFAATLDGTTHLYVTASARLATEQANAITHLVARGATYDRAALRGLDRGGTIGEITTSSRAMRIVADVKDRATAWASRDGVTWSAEQAALPRELARAAHLGKSDGTALLLFDGPATSQSEKTPPLVGDVSTIVRNRTNLRRDQHAAADSRRPADSAENAVPADQPPVEAGVPGAPESDELITIEEPVEIALAEAAAQVDDAVEQLTPASALPAESVPANAPHSDPNDPFPPMPDFTNLIDYNAWYRVRMEAFAGDNAYWSYALFLPTPDDQPGQKLPLPESVDMFTDQDNKEPPGPWNPAEHPTWDASNQAMQSFLSLYQEATLHEGYARPVNFGAATDGQTPLLIGMLLPDLGGHRRMARAAVADAWRADNGVVSGDKLIESFGTVLRGANHAKGGGTLIERLVGNAEQSLVQENARWALQRGVLNTQQKEAALQTLAALDQDADDPARSLTGEYAMSMQLVQHIFEPRTPGGKPELREDRFNEIVAMGGFLKETAADVRAAGPDVARKSAEAFDAYYRELSEQMRRGYPSVKRADLDKLTEKYVNASPLTRAILPALSRVYQIRTRGEASRRATQLSYAVSVYKDRTGRWPASLDELPRDYGTLRTDPFTGGDFGYRVGPDGPTIYSLSENGRDDGGTHSARWDDGNPESDDHVFWPPQKR